MARNIKTARPKLSQHSEENPSEMVKNYNIILQEIYQFYNKEICLNFTCFLCIKNKYMEKRVSETLQGKCGNEIYIKWAHSAGLSGSVTICLYTAYKNVKFKVFFEQVLL